MYLKMSLVRQQMHINRVQMLHQKTDWTDPVLFCQLDYIITIRSSTSSNLKPHPSIQSQDWNTGIHFVSLSCQYCVF